MLRRLALLLGLAVVLCLPAAAQEQATLVADRVALESKTLLVASGHVEIFYKGQHVSATRVRYDAAKDRLTIDGPIRITDAAGNLITADSADMTADLTEGLVRTARLVMGQQLQLSAAELERRAGGQVTEMRTVAASTCKVCGNGPPLWEIRAAKVTHDAVAQQIWFDSATLRLGGVPVIWLPVLRIPDPTLDRARGFLTPRIRSSTTLGTGVELPYFIPLGPSRDLTLSPFLTGAETRTLGLRYRQAFDTGTLSLNGAFSRDGLQPGRTRGYLQGLADFDLGGGWRLHFDSTVVSDPAYLQAYGISEDDRLHSTLMAERVTTDSYSAAQLSALRTLRETESNATQPSLLAGAESLRRLTPGALGGSLTLYGELAASRRTSHDPADLDGDGIADGRDTGRLGFGASWTRRWIGSSGLVLDGGVQAGADVYRITEDASLAGSPTRALLRGGLRLGWPLIARDAGGVTMIEPAVQLVSAATRASGAIPDEDSRLVEFDETNLFALDRFPGTDAVETGTRLNLGLTMTREAVAGVSWGATLGRVLRLDDRNLFSPASGLGGAASDWLVSGRLSLGQVGATQVAVIGRAMVDDSLSLTGFESRFALSGQRGSLSGGYEFVLADPGQGRAQDVREIKLDATGRFGDFWTLRASDRYDLSSQTTRASLGLGFQNECLSVDLSVSRRFTSSSIVEASSNFGLTVELLGLGGVSKGQAVPTCRR